MPEPFDAGTAKRHILRIIRGPGRVAFGKHADEALADDNLTAVDAVNVLRCGGVSVDGLHGNYWRYKVETRQIAVVFCFRGHESNPQKMDPSELRVITAWRKTR